MSNSESEISYREFVQRSVKTNQPSPEEYDALETYRGYLKLLPAQARRIEQEILGFHNSRSQTARPPSPKTASLASLGLKFANPSHDQSNASTADAEVSPEQPYRNSDLDLDLDRPDQPTHKEGSSPPASSSPSSQPASMAHTVAPAGMDITLLPSKPPEHYFAHRQQYGQEFSQALRSENFMLGDETRERLRKLANQLELLSSDVTDIERNKLVEVYLSTKETPVEPTPPDDLKSTSIEEKYDPALRPLFEKLEKNLKAKELKLADRDTFELLLKIIRPAQDWLDEASLRNFSTPSTPDKNAIQEIDRLWDKYSDGNFGFSQQMQIYSFEAVASNDKDLDKERQEHRVSALAFSRSAQWWIDGLEFFKYYNQLDFTAEAPRGHLPSWWFWKIPRPKVFQYGGLGLLKERGGCRVDAYTLPAFMYMLKKCGIKPR